MSEKIDRPGLKPYLNRRIQVSGNFHKFQDWDDKITKKTYATLALQDVFVGTEMVCDHVWLHHAEPLRSLEPELDLGEVVQVSAIVKEYKKKEMDQATGKMVTLVSYFLDRPEKIELPNRKTIAHRNGDTSMRLRNMSEVEDATPWIPPAKTPVPLLPNGSKPIATLPALPTDYLSLVKDCKALAKRCGGLERLRDLVQLLLEE